MKAFVFEAFGAGVAGLRRTDMPIPEPGPGQVLVKVHARSLNFRDLLILAGRYPVPGKIGNVPLSDGAGEVVALGAGVDSLRVGDRVATVYFPRWRSGSFSMPYAAVQYGCTRGGVLAEYVVADADGVIRAPDHLSYREAATLPCAAVTAWAALKSSRPILPGDTVATIGSGGVALFALQFAKLLGARTIAITSTGAKGNRLNDVGADEVVDRSASASWPQAVRELTGGRGVNHVIETGSIDTLAGSIACASENAVVTVVAALGPGTIDTSALAAPITIRRTYVGSRAHFEEMNEAIALHRLRPVLDSSFDFDDAPLAYGHFGQRKAFGKVVITSAETD